MNGHKSSGAGRRRSEAPNNAGSKKSTGPASNITPLHPVEDPPDIESFTEWDLGPVVQKSIADMGISSKYSTMAAKQRGWSEKGSDVISP